MLQKRRYRNTAALGCATGLLATAIATFSPIHDRIKEKGQKWNDSFVAYAASANALPALDRICVQSPAKCDKDVIIALLRAKFDAHQTMDAVLSGLNVEKGYRKNLYTSALLATLLALGLGLVRDERAFHKKEVKE